MANLTPEYLKSVLDYDPLTGAFIWKVTLSPKGQKGKHAGSLDSGGYRRIQINGERFRASRLAWFYAHGRFPKRELDHVNRIPNDDRLANLRECTRNENERNSGVQKNNKLGVKGVFRYKGKFRAQIYHYKESIWLGDFVSMTDAQQAYIRAAKKYHGAFACFG